MPRPVSHKHKSMSLANRSAQFAPFAALTGYGEAVEETVQLVEEQFNQGGEKNWPCKQINISMVKYHWQRKTILIKYKRTNSRQIK